MSSRPLAGSPTMPAEEAGSALGAVEPLASASADAVDELNLGAAEIDGDGELNAQRDAPVGGQAVLEGVMMRGVSNWAVAVRKPSEEQLAEGERSPEEAALGEIEVTSFPLESALKRHRALRLPIIRGIVALGGSLVIGFRALEVSANAQLPPEQREPDADATADGEGAEASEPDEIPKAVWAGTVVVALLFAIVLFFLIPVGLTSLIKDQLGSSFLFWLIEGVIRTAIFLGYMLLLSRLRDLRRVFEYHGAEHKTISCFEAGLPLTPVNAQRFSRLHPRCGTSFLLVVMIVAIFVFAPIGLPAWYWLVATRILGVPVIAGISFELIKFAGKNRSRGWVRAIMWPGLKLQLLTTREPDLDQLAVAIAALRAVLDRETPGELSAADLVGVEVVA
ncbi:MAG TPA: DUF1385 domain-containing protein [Solirubrobacteraceae bacterium]|jgi:uncharacterized protein YqhQ|nr:DUF1385 domain-containing protein [Solirubrobacteraceae bacterium]